MRCHQLPLTSHLPFPRNLCDLRKAGTWRTGSVPLVTLSAQPRPRRGCGRCSRWPLGLASRSERISAGGAAPFSETPLQDLHPHLESLHRGAGIPPSPILLGLCAEGSLFQFHPAQDCIESPKAPAQWWWQALPPPPSLTALWEPRAVPHPPGAELCCCLGLGWGSGSLWPSLEDHHTSTLYTPGSQVWGRGFGGCNPESWALVFLLWAGALSLAIPAGGHE